ncbi:anti-sigma factor [Sphingomonas sp. A2-49]|uniref:anti-sigma factor n=1 Tax=Sphingomonas sp. A2-49 TaxID=1391375 RepID=UPI0021CFE117|nr:anti-sigma factor [Sphingomonas sp. A2-49]MCU6454435.1 anti-sigma factor [Sphingomonas sp. A2-49]
MPPPDDAPLPDMAAAELALGLLDGAERDAALHRLIREPAFAGEVERWRDWLAALFAGWPAVAAPAEVAARIEASLDARAPDGMAGVPAAANDNGARWRMLALATSIAACLLLAVTTMLMLRPAPAPVRVPVAVRIPAAPPLIAAMAPTGKGTPVAAAYDPASGVVRIAGAVDVPAGRSAEVWAIEGSAAPRSLGVMADATRAEMIVPAALRGHIADDTVLAISIEPAGGSPTGLPTGPVVAAGKLKA